MTRGHPIVSATPLLSQPLHTPHMHVWLAACSVSLPTSYSQCDQPIGPATSLLSQALLVLHVHLAAYSGILQASRSRCGQPRRAPKAFYAPKAVHAPSEPVSLCPHPFGFANGEMQEDLAEG